MENIKKSWRDVTINKYYELKAALEEAEAEYEKAVKRIAFVYDMSEDDVWNLDIATFRSYNAETSWMDKFDIDDKIKFKTIELDGVKYNVDTNLQKFTVAQYVDFQTFFPKMKTEPKYMGNVLACFLIPVGKKYADGYDIQKLVETINEHLDIMTANEIVFFFLKSYLISIRVMVNYFNWMMRRLMRRAKDKAKMAEMQAEWEVTKKNILDGFRSLIR